MKNGKKHKYIKENQHLGFDQLAFKLNISEDAVKKMWNEMELGWHLTPRTLVEVRRIGHKQYELLNDLVVFIAPATPIFIPKGFVTDFASVPRLLTWFIAPDDEGIAIPAIAHDMLCRTGYMPRYLADGIFYRLMKYRRFKRAFWAFLAVFIAGLLRGTKVEPRLNKEIQTLTLDYLKTQKFDIY